MKFIVTVLTVAYPVYTTYKAIESDKVNACIKNILSYWIIYALITVLETFPTNPLSWIPLYQFVKLAVLISLHAPKYNGATEVYNKFIRASLKKVVISVDNTIASVRNTTNDVHHKGSSSNSSQKTQ